MLGAELRRPRAEHRPDTQTGARLSAREQVRDECLATTREPPRGGLAAVSVGLAYGRCDHESDGRGHDDGQGHVMLGKADGRPVRGGRRTAAVGCGGAMVSFLSTKDASLALPVHGRIHRNAVFRGLRGALLSA
jgi:hypothetical protein